MVFGFWDTEQTDSKNFKFFRKYFHHCHIHGKVICILPLANYVVIIAIWNFRFSECENEKRDALTCTRAAAPPAVWRASKLEAHTAGRKFQTRAKEGMSIYSLNAFGWRQAEWLFGGGARGRGVLLLEFRQQNLVWRTTRISRESGGIILTITWMFRSPKIYIF